MGVVIFGVSLWALFAVLYVILVGGAEMEDFKRWDEAERVRREDTD